MNDNIEYLEKYSVAPSPSRDYYGLRVLRDKVILHLWRISHGPHKTPIVYTARFADFDQNKILQDELHRVFGRKFRSKYLLRHVKDIAQGNRKTLLTLPRGLIEKIIGYLKVRDIANLSSLSHAANEIFSHNWIWEVLYKREGKTRVSREEKYYSMVHGWKQLFKEQQMQMSIRDSKSSRLRPAVNQEIAKTKQNPSKFNNAMAKIVSKSISSTNVETKKSSEIAKSTASNIAFQKSLDFRCSTLNSAASKQVNLGRKNSDLKCIQSTEQKNSKFPKSKSVMTKIDSKRENAYKNVNLTSIDSKSRQNNTQKLSAIKTSSTNVKLMEYNAVQKKSLSEKNTPPRSINKTDKIIPPLIKDRNTRQSKLENKQKAQNKSTILNTDKRLLGNSSMIKASDLELTDLIRKSLGSFNSPRGIFDHDFNYAEFSPSLKINEGTSIGSSRTPRNTEPYKYLDVMFCDELSDRSKYLNDDSTDISIKGSKDCQKQAEAQTDKLKKLLNSESVFMPSGKKLSSGDRVNILRNSPTLRKKSDEDGRIPIAKGALNSSVLKSLGSNSLAARHGDASRRSFHAVTSNLCDVKDILKNV